MRGALLIAALAACDSSHHAATTPDASPLSPDAAASPDAPVAIPSPIPIKHVVVIVKENHTFDNYFGSFPGADGTSAVMSTHGMIAPPHAPDRTTRDLCHEHSCALTDLAGNWESVQDATVNGDDLVYAQYGEADIPNYWQYARHFTLGDRFFANVLGPSFPGRVRR